MFDEMNKNIIDFYAAADEFIKKNKEHEGRITNIEEEKQDILGLEKPRILVGIINHNDNNLRR